MKLLKLSSLAIPPEWETVGRWIDYNGFSDPVAFHVKATSNPDYKAALKLAQAQNEKRYGADVPESVAIATMGRLVAQHLLNDWRGIEPAYSPEIALKLLSDPEYRILSGAVLQCAEKAGLPKPEFVDAAPTAPPSRRASKKEAV